MTTTENTGIHVAPAVSEDEMFKLSTLFSRAANAIVNESELGKRVEELMLQVTQLQDQVTRGTNHASALDDSLNDMRRQRDEAIARALQAEREVNQAHSTINDLQHTISQLKTENGELETQLTNARKDRDDFGYHNIELEDQVKVWKAKAEQARAHIEHMVSLFKLPEPTPVAEPTPEVKPEAMQVSEQEGQSEPRPTDGSTPVTSEPTASPSPEHGTTHTGDNQWWTKH